MSRPRKINPGKPNQTRDAIAPAKGATVKTKKEKKPKVEQSSDAVVIDFLKANDAYLWELRTNPVKYAESKGVIVRRKRMHELAATHCEFFRQRSRREVRRVSTDTSLTNDEWNKVIGAARRATPKVSDTPDLLALRIRFNGARCNSYTAVEAFKMVGFRLPESDSSAIARA